MLRTPMKLALEATVFSAVLAWEVYKRVPFRPKAEGPVSAEVEEDHTIDMTVDIDPHYAPRPFHWTVFPVGLVDEDGDPCSLTLQCEMPQFCPGCMEISNFVQAGVSIMLNRVEEIRHEDGL